MKAKNANSNTTRSIAAAVAGLLFAAVGTVASAQPDDYPRARVDFQAYAELVAEVQQHREDRLIDLDTFLAMSDDPNVIILDTRSKYRYDRIHVAGARHLNFADFTQDNLRQVIPDFDITVLIYCNNNFEGDQEDFPTKKVSPAALLAAGSETASGSGVTAAGEPLMMALNVPTYINLYGYGYRNVYELDELVSVDDPRVAFAGSTIPSSLESSPENGSSSDQQATGD